MSAVESRRVQGPASPLDPAAPTLFHEDAWGHYRITDPDTSEAAAVAQIGRKADTYRRVLEALYAAGDDGLTDHELAARLGLIQTSVGKRRGELRDAGLVRAAATDTGATLKRPSPSGSPAICWTLTAGGHITTETKGEHT